MANTKLLIAAAFIFLANISHSQPGCTDPQALNFDPGAIQNDGSCLYPPTSYAGAFIANLASELLEISGLEYANNEWWAHNDSGSDPVFFNINPATGAILKEITLNDAKNRDWEDACSDGANLYFGDFGNNTNNRQNLGIYKVPISVIGTGDSQSIDPADYSFLPFAYPDQFDFTPVPEDSTVFDCEAMIYAMGKLHLFTKNRKQYQTTHYVLSPIDNSIQKLETFDCQGLITGASLSPDGKTIVLVGYDLRGLPTVFCWMLWDWQPGTDHFFSGNKRRIELGSAFTAGQVESIGFYSNRAAYFANERTAFGGILFVPQRVWGIDFSSWLPGMVATRHPTASTNKLAVFPNPSTGKLRLSNHALDLEKASLQVLNSLGECSEVQIMAQEVDLRQFPNGVYTLILIWEDGSASARIVLQR